MKAAAQELEAHGGAGTRSQTPRSLVPKPTLLTTVKGTNKTTVLPI